MIREFKQKKAIKELEALILSTSYPCVAALKALKTESLRHKTYGVLGSEEAALALIPDLLDFIREQKETDNLYLSFVAIFEGPTVVSPKRFEGLLWRQLSLLHQLRGKDFSWDPHASSDPKDLKFCFSFGGEALFVVGMHLQSSRKARRLSQPALVFNLYRQFEALKSLGHYETMTKVNRSRDVVFQGSINPMVNRYGEEAEAIQYSGREVSGEWQCPFQKK